MSGQLVAFDWATENDKITPGSWFAELMCGEQSIHTEFMMNMVLRHHGDKTIKEMCYNTLHNQIPGIEELRKALPNALINLMISRTDIWIAGGSLLRSIFNCYDGEDIDIFCLSDEAHRLCMEAIDGNVPSFIESGTYEITNYRELNAARNRFYEGIATDEVNPRRIRVQYEAGYRFDMAGYDQEAVDGLDAEREQLNERARELEDIYTEEDNYAGYPEAYAPIEREYMRINNIWSQYIKCRKQVWHKIDLVNRSGGFGEQISPCHTIEELLESFDMDICQVATNLHMVHVSMNFTEALLEGMIHVTNEQSYDHDRYIKYMKFLPDELRNQVVEDTYKPKKKDKRSRSSYTF